MSLRSEAERHRLARQRLAQRVSGQVAGLWSQFGSSDLDGAWDFASPQIGATVTAGQLAAAEQSTRYVNTAAALQGGAPRASLVPSAFAGVTREGRQVVPELYAGVTRTKTLIGAGMGAGQAFQVGLAYIAVMARTLVGDAGRGADRALGVAKGLTRSVRVIQPGACSRCAILAGVIGYKANFERHPGCLCTSMPLKTDEVPDGFFRSAGDYFESLSPEEQARVFTKAGARAIREGADEIAVVNARRGMYRTPQGALVTQEGTTARGVYGRRSSGARLMPEQIFKEAGSPEEARELLRRYGFIR